MESCQTAQLDCILVERLDQIVLCHNAMGEEYDTSQQTFIADFHARLYPKLRTTAGFYAIMFAVTENP